MSAFWLADMNVFATAFVVHLSLTVHFTQMSESRYRCRAFSSHLEHYTNQNKTAFICSTYYWRKHLLFYDVDFKQEQCTKI